MFSLKKVMGTKIAILASIVPNAVKISNGVLLKQPV